jgi:glycosyltransferase involved in cell wall biosynthesis
MRPSPLKMRIILFGSYDTAAHPRVAVLAEGLSQRGHELVQCHVPLRLNTAARVAMLRRAWGLPSLALELARSWLGLTRKRLRVRSADVVLVGYMGHFDVHLARLLFPRTPIVLDHLISAADTARDRREHGRLKLALLAALDTAAVKAADMVIVDTEEHRRLLPPRVVERSIVVSVGATACWFRAGDATLHGSAHMEDDREPLRVVFFGLYTPLQGTVTIAKALGLLSGAPIEVTMIGDGQDRPAAQAAARGCPTIRWLDWVPARALSGIVAAHHVCLGIFGTTPKALRVVPNKVFQGAAAGCVVVTSDTLPQRRILGEAGFFVPPGDADALAALLRRLAADRREVAAFAGRALQRAREHFSAIAVVAPLEERLRLVRRDRPRRKPVA